MLFWKHSIWTFDCYFERYRFNSIKNSSKLILNLSSEVFFENIKPESNSRFLMYLSEFVNDDKNEKTVFLI